MVSSPDLSLTSTQNDISAAYPQVSNSTITNFTNQRLKYFKGTIGVTVIYSILLIGLIILTFFTNVLYNDYIVFISTLSIGIILVVILLVLFLVKNKPDIAGKPKNSVNCPDYWISTTVPDDELKNMGVNLKIQPLMKYRCVPNPDIMKGVYTPQSTIDAGSNINFLGQTLYGKQQYTLPGSSEIQTVGIYGVPVPKPSTSKDPYSYLINKYNPYTNNADIGSNVAVCNMVYPELMSSVDNNAYGSSGTDAQNQVRCAYANLCGIPWTDACSTTS